MLLFLLTLLTLPSEIGTSPLVEEGHTHAWIDLYSEKESQGWIDTAWRSSTMHNGREFPLVVVRLDGFEGGGLVTVDTLMAADCDKRQLGIHKAYVFRSPDQNAGEVSFEPMTMISPTPRLLPTMS